MKLFKKIFSIIIAGAFVLGTSVFSTSSSYIQNYEVENTSLISNEMGGGGTPSIDEPEGEKTKVFPQSEEDIVETEYEDEPIDYADAISWSTKHDEEIARRQMEDPSYVFSLSGSGTESDPYLIQDEYDFYYIRNKTNGYHFKLTNDIYLNRGKFVENEDTGEIEYFSRKGENDGLYSWNNVGTVNGWNIDGNGHKIFGFYGGTFIATVNNSTIKNLIFENVNQIVNSSYTKLFNYFTNSTMDNCTLDGYTVGFSTNVSSSTISNCTNKGTNTIDASIGGIANSVSGTSMLKNCTNHLSILKGAGICYSAANGVTIDGCENYGNCASGMTFDMNDYINYYVKNCKNYGETQCGFVGQYRSDTWGHTGGAHVENCENYGDSYIGVGYAKTILNCSNYGSCNRSPYFCCGIGLASQIKGCNVYSSVNCSTTYVGIAIRTSKVSSCKNFAKVENCNSFYGISFYGSQNIDNCYNYAEIKNVSSFYGVSAEATEIRYCKNYSNTSIVGSSTGIGKAQRIYNSENHGLLIATNSAVGIGTATDTIQNCVNFGNIISKNSSACGITGSSDTLKVIGCINHGNITGKNYVGGIGLDTSRYKSYLIEKCANYGNVTGSNYVGGIYASVYYNVGNDNEVFRFCHNYGTISGINSVGAIVGENDCQRCYIQDCLNTGRINGKSIKNSLVADNYRGKATIINSISNCYVNGISKKQYYGTDFSAFYVKWKTGYIGLKALDNVGVYMFAIPSEEYLQERGFVKVG